MDKKYILNLLIKHYADGNKSRFASMLGVSPQAISTWEKRNTFDIELIYSKCENLNAKWLLTGIGEMFVNDEQEPHNNSSVEPMVDKLLGIIDKKDLIIRQQAEDIGQLRAELAQLKQRLQKSADAASTERTANVG